jgi:polyisoprenoid-binding protein YceI
MQAMNFLKSKDFLDVYAYSSAILEITTSKKVATNRYQVGGYLTIKGIKRPIDFVIEGVFNENGFEGKALDVQVNREEFNIATSQASLSNDSQEQISSSVEPRFFISVFIKANKK